MGISAPSFDYQSLNAPGGIGQGLGALSGALVDAAARRRQAEAAQARLEFEKQGLARLQANDLADRSQRAMQFQEGVNHNRAQEEYQQGQLKRQDGLASLANTRYNDSMKRQAVTDDFATTERLYQHSRQDKLDAANIGQMNARAKNYSTPKTPSQPVDRTLLTPATYAQLSQQAEKQAQTEFEDSQMTHHAAVAKATGRLWNDPMPPTPPTLEALRAKHRKSLGLPDTPPTWKTAPAAPAASSLRGRVTALYGALTPELEQSLAEAEKGDAESAAQLKGILQQAGGDEAVDPDGGVDTLDLLGNPTRQ